MKIAAGARELPGRTSPGCDGGERRLPTPLFGTLLVATAT
jgi:hypothetical protein